jgi:hypothetical protein
MPTWFGPSAVLQSAASSRAASMSAYWAHLPSNGNALRMWTSLSYTFVDMVWSNTYCRSASRPV